MSLAKLDDFSFIMHENDIKQISEVFVFPFAENKKLNSHSSFQKVGLYSHELTFKGLLVAKKTDSIQALIKMGAKQKSISLVTFEHNFKVIITKINQGKDKLIPDGRFMTQSFNISLKRVF